MLKAQVNRINEIENEIVVKKEELTGAPGAYVEMTRPIVDQAIALLRTFDSAHRAGQITNGDVLNFTMSAALSVAQTLLSSAIATGMANGTIRSDEEGMSILNTFLSRLGDGAVDNLSKTADLVAAAQEPDGQPN